MATAIIGKKATQDIPKLSLIERIEPLTDRVLKVRYRKPVNVSDYILELFTKNKDRIELTSRFTDFRNTFPNQNIKSWDYWTIGDLESTIKANRTLINTINAEIKNMNLSPKSILFLGAGKCFEVNSFCQTFKNQFAGATIICADSSKVQLDSAATNTGRLIRHYNMHPKFILSTFDSLVQKFTDESLEKPDLIIAQGIFDRETLRFNEGQILSQTVRELCKDNTVCFFNAYGNNLFTLSDWRNLGFNTISGISLNANKEQDWKSSLYIVKNNPSLPPIYNQDPLIKELEERQRAGIYFQ